MTCSCTRAVMSSPPISAGGALAAPSSPAGSSSPPRAAASGRAQAGAGVATLGSEAPAQLGWPVKGGRITDVFGSHQSWRTQPHTGLDIGAPNGTPITAAAAGVVVDVKWQPGGGGNMTVVQHAGGLYTVYAHQSRIDVHVGQSVAAGETIGAVGATGNTTGPHLHLEVKRGSASARAIDPRPFLAVP